MEPVLSLPAKCIWAGPYQPAAPEAMLAALPEEAARLRAQGAGAVEFWLDAAAMDERYASPTVWADAAGILGRAGLGATVHLPMVWVDLTSLDREVWEGSLRSLEAVLRATAPLAPAMAALHPANYATQAALHSAPEGRRAGLLGALGSRLVAALTRLRGGPAGEIVALENLEGVPLDLLAYVAEAAGVGVCLDTGHALAEGLDPVAIVDRVRDRLLGLHLHDGVPRGGGSDTPEAEERAHLAVGRGNLDLERLVAALVAVDFRGPVVLEVVGDREGEERTGRLFLEAVERHRGEGGGRRQGPAPRAR